MPHPAALDPDALLADCEVRFMRRSGPGGQNRNKVETAAVLTHGPTGLTAEANERRSQGENRRVALFRLRLSLALAVRHDWTEPSPRWRSRLKGGKVVVSPSHDDFPALVAEALDAIHAEGDDLKAAAEALGCSTSQLVKLLKDEPRALARINDHRKAEGLPTYK